MQSHPLVYNSSGFLSLPQGQNGAAYTIPKDKKSYLSF